MDESDETGPPDDATEPRTTSPSESFDSQTDAGEATTSSAESRETSDRLTEADVPAIEELVGPRQTLEPEIQVVWLIRAGVSAVVLGLLVTVAFSIFLPLGPWVGGVVFAVALLLGVVFAIARYRSWSYEVREDSLYLERGVLTHVTTVVPYVRIQHVDASRGPIERAFGLATTVVYTAGSRGADVSIPGLTPERAADLQTRLKQLAIAAEGDDAV